MFAIVTRNKLRSRRYAVSMVWAWKHVRRQLGRTPGMLAYTTGIANLQEFFTLTLWEREFDMFRFMSSDAHAEMMWNFRRWSDSFWSMRFNPHHLPVGDWPALAAERGGVQAGPQDFRAARPEQPIANADIPEELLEHLPALRQYRARPHGCQPLPVEAVLARVPSISPAVVRRLRRLLQQPPAAEGLRRHALGVGAGDCLLLAVWEKPDPAGAAALIEAVGRVHPHAWATRCQATDFEIGQWDQLHLRDLAVLA